MNQWFFYGLQCENSLLGPFILRVHVPFELEFHLRWHNTHRSVLRRALAVDRNAPNIFASKLLNNSLNQLVDTQIHSRRKALTLFGTIFVDGAKLQSVFV